MSLAGWSLADMFRHGSGAQQPFPRVSSSGAVSGDARPHSPSGSGSQGHAPNSLAALKDRSVQDLENLWKNKEAYNTFLGSLEPVRRSESLVQDLKKSNLDQAKKNLAKEADIAELKNQCAIIRTTELAAARERFEEVHAREKEVFNQLSPAALSNKLHEAATEADEESENLHRQFVQGEIELAEFISTYRKKRLLYHKRFLTRASVLAMSLRG